MEETDGVRSGTGGTREVAGGGEGRALPQRDGLCGASRASGPDSPRQGLCPVLWALGKPPRGSDFDQVCAVKLAPVTVVWAEVYWPR